MFHIPLVIIGGGICGLLIARAIGKKFPHLEPIILEKEKYCGDHTTGRNSGVLHAGIYYNTGSLKHHLCLKGNKLWHDLANELGVPLKICGKYIMASTDDQVEELENFYQKALVNGVTKILGTRPILLRSPER